jgi:hypothetical protein
MSGLDVRKNVLRGYGASAETAEEVLAYNANAFKRPERGSVFEFPLADEEFVATWTSYAAESCSGQLFEFLKAPLVQLNFPIQEGISRSDEYAAVTRRGAPVETTRGQTGLQLRRPDALRLTVYQTPAGKIPILVAPEREDFVDLVRALTARNEPEPVSDAMGACIVSGYNNWDRIGAYRSTWSRELGHAATDAAWAIEFQNLIPRKHLYQDRFILLSEGFYSSVAPEALKLSGAQWREQSQVIRREHECTHYFTRRVFQSMRNLVLDELIADYSGLVAATGRFRADWFLHFMGLENYPSFRASGRLSQYRGKPPLSDQAFHVLQRILVAAAESLEEFSAGQTSVPPSHAHPFTLTALSMQTLEELAAPRSSETLARLVEEIAFAKTGD